MRETILDAEPSVFLLVSLVNKDLVCFFKSLVYQVFQIYFMSNNFALINNRKVKKDRTSVWFVWDLNRQTSVWFAWESKIQTPVWFARQPKKARNVDIGLVCWGSKKIDIGLVCLGPKTLETSLVRSTAKKKRPERQTSVWFACEPKMQTSVSFAQEQKIKPKRQTGLVFLGTKNVYIGLVYWRIKKAQKCRHRLGLLKSKK